MATLSIVVPCFNERANLPSVLDDLETWARGAVSRRAIDEYEIVVVDDGSKDGSTVDLQTTLDARHVRVVRHERNRGLTAALRTGFISAEKELVTWVPADGQIPPRALDALLAARGDATLVVSVYTHRPDGLVRAVLSKGARLLVRAIIGFGQRLEGVYLFRRDLLDRIDLVSTRSAGIVAFEIAAKVQRMGGTIASCEIDCLPRRSGHSKVADARNMADFVTELVKIRASFQ